ncbi:MAG TPA: peptidoglycan-binding protein LysM [Geobacteraceae bacterium]|nr:peptidoglycan-binding protein LysM [Geobacteraceae bacterium]
MTSRHLLLYVLATLCISSFQGVSPAHAIDPRFELDPQALREKLPPVASRALPTKAEPAAPRTSAGETVYTVRPGDNLMKILVRDFGMSDNAAESLIPEIRRRNGLIAGRRLRSGMQIVLPVGGKSTRHAAGVQHRANRARLGQADNKRAGHELTLIRNFPAAANDGIEGIRTVWDKLVPAGKTANGTVSLKGRNYSLELDPVRFPLLPAADGGKILIEAGDRLSPMVKSLIQDQDPGIRFVAYDRQDRKRFFTDILAAAGFYSVEEDFSLTFGSDPKLTVTTDFKIENDPDSTLRQDIILLNIGRRQRGFPAPLADYLARQGFRLIDLNPSGRQETSAAGSFHMITEGPPLILADRFLTALGQGFETDRAIELLSMREGGVSLSVRADRYFEKDGEKYVVSEFRGDLENYTLLRILEAQRYHVIVLTPAENFRSIAGKFLAQLHLAGSYANQDLLPDGELPYSIRMSGLMIDAGRKGGRIFMTDTAPDAVVGELLELNGYAMYNNSERVVRR